MSKGSKSTPALRVASPKLPHAVVELIFTHPYVRIANIVESKIVGREAAGKYLKELAALGVLEEEKVGRDKLFLHRKYLDVLFSDDHTFAPYQRRSTNEVPGTKRRRYLEENAAAADIALSGDELAELHTIFGPEAGSGEWYPEDMMRLLDRGANRPPQPGD